MENVILGGLWLRFDMGCFGQEKVNCFHNLRILDQIQMNSCIPLKGQIGLPSLHIHHHCHPSHRLVQLLEDVLVGQDLYDGPVDTDLPPTANHDL